MSENKNVNESREMEEIDVISLELEDGSSVECGIVDFCELEGQSYVALLEIDENGEPTEDAEMMLFTFDEEDDEFSLGNIEDEKQFQRVVDAFDAMWDEEEDDE